ncbi:MerR family transcriptional regulator [Enterococcus hulanensis]|uniref:MerR family transcriptional regulator n=1 Tax=Enterococcus hulanensis TaxID=2559929 RepID=A0ABU3EXH8_9ENTE|nr:MerR family transcriptional regulator [Enterococcus hulanensis]MDT2599573.1 MerR family transcriptional regulator [Enterococcus hulanensis]MDT2609571.1 MerR family transcriptional regulator [Enterococcus hulanensis]MDT2616148.1 MerR family transcriptional regulator [Enterococcus hulanensis]MDT2627812.1 MerR family transcriptional regulator [Enterococcus hulanensis]MDT2654917.1 MerR family transcriptional regulator [Enterococcus hulanensis]
MMTTRLDLKNMHSIGEAADLCHVSRKTLRFYEELGLLAPDYISPKNGYRYYSEDTVMMIPVLKYYKQMGFRLQEMTDVSETTDYFFHQRNFLSKLDELKKEEERIQNRYEAVSDWVGMLNEGTMARENNVNSINLKYVERDQYYFLDQEFNYDYKKSIINVEWTNYLEAHESEITGAVILSFSDYKEKASGKAKRATVVQKPVRNSKILLPRQDFGGQMFICKYHLGDPKDSAENYYQIEKWASERNYQIGPNCYERYVIDYWAIQDTNQFVTEIMIPALKM